MLSSPLPVLSVRLDGTPPSSCKVQRVCVCVWILAAHNCKISWRLQCQRVGAARGMLSGVKLGGEGRGRKRRVETKRGKERKGICVHSELSKDSASTSVQWGTAARRLDDIRGRRRSTPAARRSEVARRSSGECSFCQRDTKSSKGAIYQATYYFDLFYCVQTEAIKQY